MFGVDQHGRWLLGPASSYSETFKQKVGITDPGNGTYVFNGIAGGLSRSAILKLTPTNSTPSGSRADQGSEVPQPYFEATVANGLSVVKSDGSTGIAYFSDSGGLQTRELRSLVTTTTGSGAAPSVNGIGTLLINNGGAVSITNLSGGDDGQIVQLIFQNANTTVVSSASLLMQGSVDVTPTAWSVITVFKIPTGTSNRWVELSRSIKQSTLQNPFQRKPTDTPTGNADSSRPRLARAAILIKPSTSRKSISAFIALFSPCSASFERAKKAAFAALAACATMARISQRML